MAASITITNISGASLKVVLSREATRTLSANEQTVIRGADITLQGLKNIEEHVQARRLRIDTTNAPITRVATSKVPKMARVTITDTAKTAGVILTIAGVDIASGAALASALAVGNALAAGINASATLRDLGVVARAPFSISNGNAASNHVLLIEVPDSATPNTYVASDDGTNAAVTSQNGTVVSAAERYSAHITETLAGGLPFVVETPLRTITSFTFTILRAGVQVVPSDVFMVTGGVVTIVSAGSTHVANDDVIHVHAVGTV